MKIIKPILTLLTALLLAPALRASEPTAESPPSPGALEALFANPPRDAGPEVWWHWPPAIPVRSVRRARVGKNGISVKMRITARTGPNHDLLVEIS